MAYATLQNLIDSFGETEINQLADRDNDGLIDTALITLVQNKSASLIDSYLGSIYITPIVNPPEIIVGIDCDIQRYYLYDDNPTDRVVKGFDASIAWLEKVNKGLIRIKATTINSISQNSGAINYIESERMFSRDAMRYL